MKWSGLNKSILGYGGARIDIDAYYDRIRDIENAENQWKVEYKPSSSDHYSIPLITNRSPEHKFSNPIYLSSGIHGDEPAGPLALLGLLEKNFFLPSVLWTIFPILNPTGILSNSRTNINGQDLNRDYHPNNQSPQIEVSEHLKYLKSCSHLDFSIMIHEDWEAQGFYLYQLHKGNPKRYGHELVSHLKAGRGQGYPIDQNSLIDGREANMGVIDVCLSDHMDRPDWPESFFISNSLSDLCYTLESPSDLDLKSRVEMLSESISFLVRKHLELA